MPDENRTYDQMERIAYSEVTLHACGVREVGKPANFHVEVVMEWTKQEIIERYWSAMVEITHQTSDILSDDAILLALRLAVQDAYAAGKRDSEVDTRNRRQNMAHVDGDDYTYDGICTAEQHQAEQDAKIAKLQNFIDELAVFDVHRKSEINALQSQSSPPRNADPSPVERERSRCGALMWT